LQAYGESEGLDAVLKGRDGMKLWKTGDAVLVTYGDRTLSGTVRFASENGMSLFLVFDGMLDGYVGSMPVLWDSGRQEFLDLMNRNEVVLQEPPKA
jgi:hypothetical protein